jgi:hypothetical protein
MICLEILMDVDVSSLPDYGKVVLKYRLYVRTCIYVCNSWICALLAPELRRFVRHRSVLDESEYSSSKNSGNPDGHENGK